MLYFAMTLEQHMPERKVPGHHPSVIVIGAGIVGASCAYFLSARGAAVQVLEQHAAPASEATGKSAAGIRHQFSQPHNVRFSQYSADFFRRFSETVGGDAGYRTVGYLFLFSAEAQERWLSQHQMQRQLGVTVEILKPESIAARFPYINLDGIAGASFGAEDGVLDPHGITLGFLQKARAQGATLHTRTPVTGLEYRHGTWHVITPQGTFHADAVVNATGAFADSLAQCAGFALPVQPHRRNVYVTTPMPQLPHPTPLMIDDASGLWIRSEGTRFIFGLSNAAEPAGNRQNVDWGWLETVLATALPRFPFLEAAELDERACWAGLYAITPDHLPILGAMPGQPGFYNACGFSGHGVQHAPATGLVLSEEILDGAAHSLAINPFRYARFDALAHPREQNIV